MTILIVALFAASYPALMILLAKAVHPSRVELFTLGEALLADKRVTAAQASRLNHMLDTAVAFRVGLILPLAALAVALDEIIGRPEPAAPETWLDHDPRYHAMMLKYLVSICAANPIGPIASIPFSIVGVLVSAIRGLPILKATVEIPLLRASEGMPMPIGVH